MVQLQPVPVAAVGVSPAGRARVSVTGPASALPELSPPMRVKVVFRPCGKAPPLLSVNLADRTGSAAKLALMVVTAATVVVQVVGAGVPVQPGIGLPEPSVQPVNVEPAA